MRFVVIVVLTLSGAAKAAACCDNPPPSCTTLATCVEKLRALDAGTVADRGLDDAQQAVSAGFEALSPPPIDTLIELLDDPGPKRRNVAAHALGMLKARAAVPALTKHLDDTDWAQWALSRIGDPRSLPAMLKQLDDFSHADGDAIARFGSVGVTALAKVLVDRRASVTAQHGAMSAMSGHSVDGDVDVSEAVDILRRAIPTADARLDWIVLVLASFGPRAAAAIPEVRALRTRTFPTEPRTVQLGQGATSTSSMPDIDIVLVQLGDTASVPRVAERLRSDESGDFYDAMYALTPLGPRAVAAVPTLTEVLRHGSFKQQAVAARVLGSIADPSTATDLVAAFDVRSWRVVGEAARALGRIGVAAAPTATTALEALRETHWSVVVREVADVALRRTLGEQIAAAEIDDEEGFVGREHRVGHGGIACAFQRVDSGSMQWKARVDDEWVDLRNLFDGPPLPSPLPGQLAPKHGTGQIFVSGDSTFVARTGGEWYGDLHVVEAGVATRLADRNTSGVVSIGADVFAVGGLAHLGTNEGLVTHVRRVDGRWQARELVELPSEPHALAVVDGRLVVGILGPEVLVVDVDGGVQPVPCSVVGQR